MSLEKRPKVTQTIGVTERKTKNKQWNPVGRKQEETHTPEACTTKQDLGLSEVTSGLIVSFQC